MISLRAVNRPNRLAIRLFASIISVSIVALAVLLILERIDIGTRWTAPSWLKITAATAAAAGAVGQAVLTVIVPWWQQHRHERQIRGKNEDEVAALLRENLRLWTPSRGCPL